jgi:peroxiredoxin Q/BCP
LIGACGGQTTRPDGGTGHLEVGAEVPALSTTAHDGTQVSLRELGKPAVVYFYPADDTPGCTKEACAFRDIWSEYQAAGVLVIGVSTQDLESHQTFAKQHELPFPLVADTDETWAKSFGVSLRAGYAERVSFLIDASGKVAKVYPGVDPGVHAREVLDDAARL